NFPAICPIRTPAEARVVEPRRPAMIPMRRIERQAQIADAVAGIRISSSPLHYLEVEPSASRTPRSMNCLQVSGVSLLEALQRQPQVDPPHRLELRDKQLAVWRPPPPPSEGVHRRPEAALREPFDLELDLVDQHCSVPSSSSTLTCPNARRWAGATQRPEPPHAHRYWSCAKGHLKSGPGTEAYTFRDPHTGSRSFAPAARRSM